jgi:hypothetical protein
MVISRFVAGSILLAALAAALPESAVAAGQEIHIVQSVEDPNVTPDLSVCDLASFTPNAVLAASLYAVQTRASDARLVNRSRRVGFGTACIRITSLNVGATAQMFSEFNIGNRQVLGEGVCVVGENSVPAAGLILAGCTIALDPAAGVAGGIATSNTVFNPFDLPGYRTGSIWTVQLFVE